MSKIKEGKKIKFGKSISGFSHNKDKCYLFALANLFNNYSIIEFNKDNKILNSIYIENKVLEIYGYNYFIDPVIRNCSQSFDIINKYVILDLFTSLEGDKQENVNVVCPFLLGVKNKNGEMHRILMLFQEHWKGFYYHIIDSSNENVVTIKTPKELTNYLLTNYKLIIDICALIDKKTNEYYIDDAEKFNFIIDTIPSF